MLAERGFRGATMRAIASRAGVGTAAIYRRHQNREELLAAAVEVGLGVRQVENTGQTELDLISMLTVVKDTAWEGWGFRLLAAVILEADQHPELLAVYRRRAVWPRRKLIRSILERAVRRGELRDDIDLEAAVDLLWGSVFARFVSGSNSPAGTVGAAVKIGLAGLKRSERAPKVEMGYETVR